MNFTDFNAIYHFKKKKKNGAYSAYTYITKQSNSYNS